MKRNNQRGSALIFALILLLVLSAMAGSLVFLSQSETWSSMNYRMMTQARYGAEAGVNAAANFLMTTYVPPAPTPANGLGCNVFPNYNACAYPVTDAAGNPIYLSTLGGQPANDPSGQQAAFAAAVSGSLQAGANTVNYTASAQLMSMTSVQGFGQAQPVTVQTWQITAHGDISNVRNAEAEVVTTLERYISPAFSYAAFADSNQCAALSFAGNGTTNGYDSSTLAVSGGVVQAPSSANLLGYGGDVGTNGNQNDSGNHTTINGTLSSPSLGLGVCTAGAMTALSGGSLKQVTGGLIQMPQAVNMPNPSITPPLPGSPDITKAPSGPLGPCPSPCNLGDIQLTGGTLVLTPGTYNINSISISGNASIQIAPYPPGTPLAGQNAPVILNVANEPTTLNPASSNNPIKITGNAIDNPTYDPSMLQITCCAYPPPPPPNTPPTAPPLINIAGNGANAAVVYAPNANVDFLGNAKFYGSVIANKLFDVGNGDIYYDLKLKKKLVTIGNYVLNAFTWNKY